MESPAFGLTLFLSLHSYRTMALPRAHQASFTPSEIEFIAGNEKIHIIPKAKLAKMNFIQVSIQRRYAMPC